MGRDPSYEGFLLSALRCQKCLVFVCADILAPPSTGGNANQPPLKRALKLEREAGSQCIAAMLALSCTRISSSFSRFDVSFPFSLLSPPRYIGVHHFLKLNKPGSSSPSLRCSCLFPWLSC